MLSQFSVAFPRTRTEQGRTCTVARNKSANMSHENQPQQCQWSEEKCIRLIREFRQRPVLWDPKNPMFYKKRVKAAAWIEISNLLQIPPDSCTHKMGILQSSFRREKARMRKSLESESSSKVYQSTWFGFEDMLFLLDKDNERNRKSMGNEDKDYECSSETNCAEENETSPTTVGVDCKIENPISLKRSFMEKDSLLRKKHKSYATHHRQSQQAHTPMPRQQPTTSMTSHNENEINFFANFIASKMMKYSETTKNAVQQAICEVIFQADQNVYEANEDPLTPVNMADLPTSSIKISYSDSGDSD